MSIVPMAECLTCDSFASFLVILSLQFFALFCATWLAAHCLPPFCGALVLTFPYVACCTLFASIFWCLGSHISIPSNFCFFPPFFFYFVLVYLLLCHFTSACFRRMQWRWQRCLAENTIFLLC